LAGTAGQPSISPRYVGYFSRGIGALVLVLRGAGLAGALVAVGRIVIRSIWIVSSPGPLPVGFGRYDRRLWSGATYCRLTGMNPSERVGMKLTIASSSASDRPRRPIRLLFMLSVDSGAGQHVVPSLT